jgi:hypothetical protein
MDFAELSYWLDAMTDYERMRASNAAEGTNDKQ